LDFVKKATCHGSATLHRSKIRQRTAATRQNNFAFLISTLTSKKLPWFIRFSLKAARDRPPQVDLIHGSALCAPPRVVATLHDPC
jgi:hypothetical protein